MLSEKPLLAVDGAHNAASADMLRAAIEKYLPFERLHLVLGLSAGKDAHGVLEALAPRAQGVYLTRSHHERSAPPRDLAPLVREVAPRAEVAIYDELVAALEAALGAALVSVESRLGEVNALVCCAGIAQVAHARCLARPRVEGAVSEDPVRCQLGPQ